MIECFGEIPNDLIEKSNLEKFNNHLYKLIKHKFY